MKNAGIGLTPENRKLEGLILIHSILDNLCYASMNLTSKNLIEDKKKRLSFGNKQVNELEIKVPNVNRDLQLIIRRQSAKSGRGQLVEHQPEDHAV